MDSAEREAMADLETKLSTALCFTLKLPLVISMFVRDPEPLLS
jgi:hypothetical protein